MVADGQTGAPTGEGFYVWENGAATEAALPGPELPHRGQQHNDPAVE
jgi:3-hydroxybutyryl-CoA dehydrogenase